jgi:HipA-like C-terminal domain
VAVDFEALERRLVQELALVGSASAATLRARLGVSQPTFSRLAGRLGDRLLVAGRASTTRYAARRDAQGLADRLQVYEIGDAGRARRLARLHAVLPEGYYVEANDGEVANGFHRDLPYFLHDLRPAGFLGRLLPRQHPELELPSDVRLWSSNDVLRYVSRLGWNLPGNLIVGDDALQRYLDSAAAPLPVVELRERRRRYPKLALEVLQLGAPGSSAGGEQPKFLATRAPATAVLVKFSPRGHDARSRRQADLLIAEHLALRVLETHGEQTSRSQLVVTPEQVFLEVERFDRLPGGGRRGVISLLALDAEYLGRMKTWTDSVERLAAAGHVPETAVESSRVRELFGRLIGNTDMHPGNLSFMARGTSILGLSPVYDMLPAFYAGTQGNAGEPELQLAAPSPADAGVWDRASRAAIDLWQAVADESDISASFRRVARGNQVRVEAFREVARRLPG